MNYWRNLHYRPRTTLKAFATAVAVGAMLAAGSALAVNKDPPKTKVGPPRETHGAPPCVPVQDYSGNYVCTDPSGTRWSCTIETSGWHCKEIQDPAAREPKLPKKP